MTPWAQWGFIFLKAQTLTGHFLVFTGIILKVPGISQSGTFLFIALIHPIHRTIALPVYVTGPAKRQKKTSCIYYRQDQTRSVAHTSFLPRQCDVIASSSFGAWRVQKFSTNLYILMNCVLIESYFAIFLKYYVITRTKMRHLWSCYGYV